MSAIEQIAQKIAPLLRHKSTVDGKEIEHVYLVSGGFGTAGQAEDAADDTDAAGGGGGAVIPLGAYYAEDGDVRFHVNPVVAMWASIPLAFLATCVLRGFFRAVSRKGRCGRRAKNVAPTK